MSRDWSRNEVDEVIRTYFKMLKHELKGESYVKAEYRRELLPRLDKRSKGAAEFKFQNVSAVLVELGYPYVEGYKPLSNYQTLLQESVTALLDDYSSLQSHLDDLAEVQPQLNVESTPSFDSILVDPPKERLKPSASNSRVGRKVNFIEREQKNRALGTAGEKYILTLEKKRLTDSGRQDLADKIEWVANTQGDGLGFDILSYEHGGDERYIEVKTTTQGKSMPFYVSANEVDFSREVGECFFLYRLFNFSKAGQGGSLFILRGPVSDHCNLSPQSYRADPGVKE